MVMREQGGHPWMGNSLPALKQQMLDEIGVGSIEQLFEQIPQDHRLRAPLDLPPGIRSELALRRHLTDMLSRNESADTHLTFLGAGCWPHHVPAVVDEIVGRTEFLTPVWGSAQSDFGRNQAWFEYASQLGELLNMEVVGLPVYSWGCAIGHALRMAARLTGRREIVIAEVFDPERLSVVENYCEPTDMPSHIKIRRVKVDAKSGLIDLDDLKTKVIVQDRRGLFRDRPPISACSRPTPRRSRASPASTARKPSSASTPSPSASCGRRRISAPTSWSARPSRSACT